MTLFETIIYISMLVLAGYNVRRIQEICKGDES